MAGTARAQANGLSGSALGWVGLIALAAPFLVSGVAKLTDFTGAIGEVRALTGVAPPLALWLAALVIAVQLGGSALLLSGRRWAIVAGCVLLGGFTIAATLVAHSWWLRAGPERARDMAIFFEHVAICGGFALAAMLAARR